MNPPQSAPASSGKIWLRPSVIALVLANLVPLFGVMFWDWKVLPLMLLFWSENVIVGVFNVLKMLVLAGRGGGQGAEFSFGTLLNWILRFCLLYGFFTWGHGVFVLAVFGGGHILARAPFPTPGVFWSAIMENHLQWAILGLVVSRGISFVQNFLMNGEFREADIAMLMILPFGRMLVLHIAILIGGTLMLVLGSPMIGLLILVLLKIGLDLAAHLRERRKFAAQAAREQQTFLRAAKPHPPDSESRE